MKNLQSYQFETATIHCDDNNSGNVATLILNRETKQAEYFTVNLKDNITMEMVYITEGTFIMGSPEKEQGRSEDESPQHEVKVSSFFMSKYLITQAQYLAVMNDNPSTFQGENKPVEKVSWYDASEFCDKLLGLTGIKFRLPSEAEWEYACRAGTDTPFYCGETISTHLANYKGTFGYGNGGAGISRNETTDVGSFLPNGFGLYDLYGNVWEWCRDTWHDGYHHAPNDSKAWEDEETHDEKLPRVLRGGSWDDTSYYCRSAVRLWTSPIAKGKLIGFRVACD